MLKDLLKEIVALVVSGEGERTDVMPKPPSEPMPTPTTALIANLGLTLTPKRCLEFTGFKTVTFADDAAFKALLADVAKSGYKTNPPTVQKPPYTRLSIRPIDTDLSYLVVRLDDELAWHFPEGKWITFGVDRSGDHPPHFSRFWVPIRSSDNVAYVTVDGPAFCRAPATQKFNFYVNFDGTGLDDHVPIIIDPEIKWPEGNG